MKKVITVLILLVIVFSYVSAESGIIQWRYKIHKFVEEGITLGFTDLTGNPIDTYSLNTEKTLSNAQIHLSVVTNKMAAYTLALSFTPLVNEASSTYGLYKARVTDIITFEGSEADFRDVVFTGLDPVRVSFPGDVSDDASNTISFFYPISFDFSDYIADYGTGTYTGTITVEVAVV